MAKVELRNNEMAPSGRNTILEVPSQPIPAICTTASKGFSSSAKLRGLTTLYVSVQGIPNLFDGVEVQTFC